MSKSKRIVSQLSIEDLLKVAAESSEKVVMDKISDAAKFIYNLGVKPGETAISAQLIYYTYKEWRGWNNKKQPRMQFFREFSKHFDSKRTSDGIHYMLNPKPFDLSKNMYWLVRADIRREKAKRKKHDN